MTIIAWLYAALFFSDSISFEGGGTSPIFVTGVAYRSLKHLLSLESGRFVADLYSGGLIVENLVGPVRVFMIYFLESCISNKAVVVQIRSYDYNLL